MHSGCSKALGRIVARDPHPARPAMNAEQHDGVLWCVLEAQVARMLARGDRDNRPAEEQAIDQDENAGRQPDQRADKFDRLDRRVSHVLGSHQFLRSTQTSSGRVASAMMSARSRPLSKRSDAASTARNVNPGF